MPDSEMPNSKSENIWYHFYKVFELTRYEIAPWTSRSWGERSITPLHMSHGLQISLVFIQYQNISIRSFSVVLQSVGSL